MQRRSYFLVWRRIGGQLPRSGDLSPSCRQMSDGDRSVAPNTVSQLPVQYRCYIFQCCSSSLTAGCRLNSDACLSRALCMTVFEIFLYSIQPLHSQNYSLMASTRSVLSSTVRAYFRNSKLEPSVLAVSRAATIHHAEIR